MEIVAQIRKKDTARPILAIKAGKGSYTCGGGSVMDKTCYTNEFHYTYENNIVIIERQFIAGQSLSDKITQHILESYNMDVAYLKEKDYNNNSNTAVVSSTEEGCN